MVKKSFLMILALVMGAALLASPAWAVGRQFVEVGLGLSWYDYQEDLTPPHKSNETGRLPSAYISYTYQGVDNPIYAGLSFRYKSQNTDYDGSYQDGTPAKSTTANTWWDFEFVAGYIIRNILDSPVRLIPYAGLGYRMWEREDSDINSTAPYKEEYTWWYLPLGVRLDVPLTNDFTVGLDASVRIAFAGQLQIDFTYDPTLQSDDLSLGSRIGYKFQAPMNYQFTPAFSVTLNPWYEFVRIGSSAWENVYRVAVDSEGNAVREHVTDVKEPSSDTHEYGVDVGVRFWF